MKDLETLLSPITIRNLELANRCVLPPMGTNLGTREGFVTEANIAYLKRRAQSGMGLIISEIVGVHPSGLLGLAACDDQFVPGLSKLAEAVHQTGVKVAAQLHHAGREAMHQLKKGTALGPSAIPSRVYGMAPKEMTKDDIGLIIESFGQAALRVKKAGFDALEIHGAHGYLITQFLSGLSNQRTDEYGGNFKIRARFAIEVVEEIRRLVGDDFPVFFRISAEEFIKNGYTPEDVQTIVPDLVKAGVDVIHASIGTHGSPGGITSAPPEFEEGWNAVRAGKIKAVAGIPIIAVGRFSDPRSADAVIARGDADMVAFGRQALADPDFLIKAKQGRYDEINKCLACNQGCIERLMMEKGATIRCAINPETGQELIRPHGRSDKSKKVWVIGAGPGGLTTAKEAARRGHVVTLFEKDAELGGQVRFAGKAPFKTLYKEWITVLVGEVKKSGVTIKNNTEVKEEMAASCDADVVVLATGGVPIMPDIEGADHKMVAGALQIIDGKILPGKNVVVIGGGLIGMETADFLVEKGSRVTIVEQLSQSPVLEFTVHGYQLHKRLKNGGCRLLLNTRVERIEDNAVITRTGEKRERLTPVDQVVVAVGMKPQSSLKRILEEGGIEHHVIGDAKSIRRIIEATDEGAKAAWGI